MNNLTAAQQRALLQLIESMIITALIAGLLSIAPLIESDAPLNWQKIGLFFLLAVLFSLAHSAVAYFKSNNADLGAVLEGAVQALEKRVQQAPLQGVENASVKPIGQSSTSGYPNIPATIQVRPIATTQPNSALVDTAPRLVVQPPVVQVQDQQ